MNAQEWVERQNKNRQTYGFLERFTRSGGSPTYSRVFAEAGATDPWKFMEVTGAHLKLYQQRGVPAEYAVAAIAAGHQADDVLQLWTSGIPLEYVVA